MAELVRLEGVGVRFRKQRGLFRSVDFWAIHDVDFAVNHGEILGVIGPNGAGKSTILRVLAEIISPDRGRIVKSGPYRAALLSLKIGFLPHLSGRENIFLNGMLMGITRRHLRARESALIEFSGLGDAIDDPVRTYSSGMRSRLGYAIAREADPDILLLDELLSVGDAEFNARAQQDMDGKIRSQRTVVLVSHSLEAVTQYCGRVIWIEDGVVRQVGPAAEVAAAYQAGRRTAANRGQAPRGNPARQGSP